MPDRSRFASLGRWTVPRWLFTAWVWAALPISVGFFYGCEGTGFEHACSAVSNSNFSMPWELPAITMLFGPREAPTVVKLFVPLAFTVAAHLAIRRWAPPHPPAWAFASFILGWTILGIGVFIAWLTVVALTT